MLGQCVVRYCCVFSQLYLIPHVVCFCLGLFLFTVFSCEVRCFFSPSFLACTGTWRFSSAAVESFVECMTCIDGESLAGDLMTVQDFVEAVTMPTTFEARPDKRMGYRFLGTCRGVLKWLER